MGRHLAGRVTAVLGTHTHVQTNDAALWGGTAYLTDCGMTGPHDSVIGVAHRDRAAALPDAAPAEVRDRRGRRAPRGRARRVRCGDGARDGDRDVPPEALAALAATTTIATSTRSRASTSAATLPSKSAPRTASSGRGTPRA